ncbi:unnamed protein product [Mytilus edulis]|uniref:C-type lectin domain-containing protein n=1 Tax=Mytilus edulis TaxID=6550 RepID=A0A8S3U2B1_MYTED|nr:unnamed protein product [Mytilus edulis]
MFCLTVIALVQREPLAASQGVVCPTGFQNVHGSCYWVSITPTTWKAATVICQSHNAHLADFSTDDEIVPVMLHAVIPKSSSFKYRDPKVWIDAVYSPSKRHWIWSHDSSLVNYRYFSQLAHSPGTTERCVFAIVNTGIHPWAHIWNNHLFQLILISFKQPIVIDSGTICLSCNNLAEGELCTGNEVCKNDEVCFIQKYSTNGNEYRYDVGCAYPELCQKDLSVHILGRRSDHSHVLCHECCNNTDVCNAHLSCNAKISVSMQKCLSCSEIDDPKMCNNVTTCAKDEICYLHKYTTHTNQQLFDVGCKHSALCTQGYSNILARRSSVGVHQECESCCSGAGFCNHDLQCNHVPHLHLTFSVGRTGRERGSYQRGFQSSQGQDQAQGRGGYHSAKRFRTGSSDIENDDPEVLLDAFVGIPNDQTIMDNFVASLCYIPKLKPKIVEHLLPSLTHK